MIELGDDGSVLEEAVYVTVCANDGHFRGVKVPCRVPAAAQRTEGGEAMGLAAAAVATEAHASLVQGTICLAGGASQSVSGGGAAAAAAAAVAATSADAVANCGACTHDRAADLATDCLMEPVAVMPSILPPDAAAFSDFVSRAVGALTVVGTAVSQVWDGQGEPVRCLRDVLSAAASHECLVLSWKHGEKFRPMHVVGDTQPEEERGEES
jgi:hypothetical protein